MKDISLMQYLLGLEIWKVSREIVLSQVNYEIDIFRRFMI
jgi:hypothetical protein